MLGDSQELQIHELADGRSLEYFDNGIESDRALIFHNGTTLALDCFAAWLDAATAAGVRAVAINRPGVGASTRNPGRRIIDDVNDAIGLQKAIGVREFVAIGFSGGGARALGTGMFEGCLAVLTVAGVSNGNPEILESVYGFDAEQVAHRMALIASWDAVIAERGVYWDEIMGLTFEAVLAEFMEVPNFAKFEADYRRFAEDFRVSMINALKNGPETDADDWFANINPWGFEISDLKVPVTIWHGTADDDVVIARGEYNHSQIPQSIMHRAEGQGHMSILVEYRDEVLETALRLITNK